MDSNFRFLVGSTPPRCVPGDLPVFLAFAGQARRRNEDHALALEAHPAHLIAADPGRIRRRVNPRDKPLAIIGVVTAIGAIFPADAGSSVRPSHTTDIMRPSAVKVRRPRALPPSKAIPLSQVDQYLGLAGRIR